MQFKYYLGYENDRNTQHAAVYTDLIRRAMSPREVVLVGHHFVCEFVSDPPKPDEDLKTLNEIPSADTLIFDHDIMRAVFGDHAIDVMVDCAKVPASQRDACLKAHLTSLDADKTAQGMIESAENEGWHVWLPGSDQPE